MAKRKKSHVAWEDKYIDKVKTLEEIYRERAEFLANFILPGFDLGQGDTTVTTPGTNVEAISGISEFDDFINEAGATYSVDPYFIAAIIKKESSFNPKAGSHAGAQGLMQLMPATAKSLGCDDPWDPKKNIMAGTKYIDAQLKAHNEDPILALAAYNAGPGNVKKYGGVPPFKETQDYVVKVPAFFKEFSGRDVKDGVRGTIPISTSTELPEGGSGPTPDGIKIAKVQSDRVVIPPAKQGYHASIAKLRRSKGNTELVTMESSKFYNNLSSTMLIAPEFVPVVHLIYDKLTSSGIISGKMPINSAFRKTNNGAADNGAHGWGAAIDIGITGGVKQALQIADTCWALGLRRVAIGGRLTGGGGFVHVDIGPPGSWNYDSWPTYTGPNSWSSYR